MTRSSVVGLLWVVGACNAAPVAPTVPRADAGTSPLVDAGAAISDAGFVRPDAGIERGSVDAGYTTETPPPIEGAPCNDACAGSRCAEECLFVCRLAGPGLREDQRPEFYECVRENPCSVDDVCLDNPPDAPEICEQVCALSGRQMDACGVDFAEADEHCGLLCGSTLARMAPAAQQAFQNCLDEGCGVDRSMDCDPDQFYGPTPSQTCIDYARNHTHCIDTDEHWWSLVWKCEMMRSPAGQEDLGGNALVECLAGNPACDDMGFFGCMMEIERSTGRADAIRLACADAARCSDDLGGGCRFYMSGITPLMGGEAVRVLGECLTRAGDRCGAIDDCLQSVFEPSEDSVPTCLAGCERCGQVDEACVEICVHLGNSLSVDDAETYRTCLNEGACGDLLPDACLGEVLPWVEDACSSFVDTLHDVCPEARAYPAAYVRAFCAMSGVRSGAFGGADLVDCAQRVGCTEDSIELCLRGALQ